ncbi:TfoX/Sxy family protein [Methanolobus sp. ZRKC2]|uniref:TfoX/Sxy family protein n=1 Tax=Methanolobus sp. ZRKC2 TaxID=3125783 RepID=UPI00324BE462
MNSLSSLPNIGKKLEKELQKTGICNAEELMDIGSKEAFKRIMLIDETSCINKLYALEGAIRGIRWHHLPDEEKKSLKSYFVSLK